MSTISRKGKLAGLAAVGSLALILSACGSAPEATNTPKPSDTAAPTETTEPTETAAPSGDGDFLACAVSDEGSWNDKSFNEAAYGGLLKAEQELGVQLSDWESANHDAFGPNLEAALAANCDITFAVGFNFADEGSLERLAGENPEAHFGWVDGWPLEGVTNIKPIMYSTEQAAYLAGYASAAFSKTGKVAGYGGMEIPSVTVFLDGFRNGAEQYAIDSGKDITVLPDQFVGDFANTTVAKQISESFLAEGADVIFPVAGGLFTATDEAIVQAGADAVWVGVDLDIAANNPEYKDRVLTSVEKLMTQTVFDNIKMLVDGDAFTGDPYVGSLENGGVRISPFYDFDSQIPEEIKTKLAELEAAMIAGTLDPMDAPAAN